MPSRRSVLGSLAALGGCVGRPRSPGAGDTDTDPASPTGSPNSPTRTDTNGRPSTPARWAAECDAVAHDWVDPVRDDVEPRDLPDRPEYLTRSSAKRFVANYEEAYLYNSVLQPDTEAAGASAWNAQVAAVGDGFVVHVKSVYYYDVADVSTATSSSTVVHADGPETWKGYFVGPDRLVRAEGEYDAKPDPRKSGTTVECW